MINRLLNPSRAEQSITSELTLGEGSTFAETATPVRPQDALLSEMCLPLRQTFFPLGYAVEILTNDAAVLKAAWESFGHRTRARDSPLLQVRVGVHRGSGSGSPAEPSRRQYNHLYSLVADGENQALLDLHSCTNFVWVTEQVAQHRLYFRYNFLEKVTYLLLGSSVVTDLHGACVSRKGMGILLCGNSGAGKSTLAYGCARAGWTYTSDDTSYLINDLPIPRVIGHAHRVRFRPAAQELFPELRGRVLTPRLEGKPSIEVLTSELPVSSTENEAAVHAVVFLRRYTAATAKLVPFPKGTATNRLCQELYSVGEIRAKHTAILKALADVPAYELHYCGLLDGIEALEQLTAMI